MTVLAHAAAANALAPHGLNLSATTDVARYDAAVPARCAVGTRVPDARTRGRDRQRRRGVLGGLPASSRTRAARRRAAGSARRLHALGRAARPSARRVSISAAAAGRPSRSRTRPLALSFAHLAECAGLGRPSLLGVLVHPEFGPWIALRAAILLPFALPAPRPADGFDPCPTLRRAAVHRRHARRARSGPRGWDVAGCAAHRLSGAGRRLRRGVPRADRVRLRRRSIAIRPTRWRSTRPPPRTAMAARLR